MNRIDLVGDLTEIFEYSHEIHGEKFYKGQVSIKRLSDEEDLINLQVSEVLLSDSYEVGDTVMVVGEVRSRNNNGRLETYVFPELLEKTNEQHKNEVVIEGYIAKPVKIRRTPLGRLISDLFVAVHRKNITSFIRTDYIPCICWGRGASFSASFDTGMKIHVVGRLQSRTYTKYFDEENRSGQKNNWGKEVRTVNEISVKEVAIISEDN